MTLKRPSRAKALRAWCLDMEGVTDSQGRSRPATVDQGVTECRRLARERYAALVAAHGGLKRAVNSICANCAGGGADPSLRRTVRDCPETRCPLFEARPWQSVRGRQGKPCSETLQSDAQAPDSTAQGGTGTRVPMQGQNPAAGAKNAVFREAAP